MTPQEIREEFVKRGAIDHSTHAFFLAEIAAQLAEHNQIMRAVETKLFGIQGSLSYLENLPTRCPGQDV